MCHLDCLMSATFVRLGCLICATFAREKKTHLRRGIPLGQGARHEGDGALVRRVGRAPRRQAVLQSRHFRLPQPGPEPQSKVNFWRHTMVPITIPRHQVAPRRNQMAPRMMPSSWVASVARRTARPSFSRAASACQMTTFGGKFPRNVDFGRYTPIKIDNFGDKWLRERCQARGWRRSRAAPPARPSAVPLLPVKSHCSRILTTFGDECLENGSKNISVLQPCHLCLPHARRFKSHCFDNFWQQMTTCGDYSDNFWQKTSTKWLQERCQARGWRRSRAAPPARPSAAPLPPTK